MSFFVSEYFIIKMSLTKDILFNTGLSMFSDISMQFHCKTVKSQTKMSPFKYARLKTSLYKGRQILLASCYFTCPIFFPSGYPYSYTQCRCWIQPHIHQEGVFFLFWNQIKLYHFISSSDQSNKNLGTIFLQDIYIVGNFEGFYEIWAQNSYLRLWVDLWYKCV